MVKQYFVYISTIAEVSTMVPVYAKNKQEAEALAQNKISDGQVNWEIDEIIIEELTLNKIE